MTSPIDTQRDWDKETRQAEDALVATLPDPEEGWLFDSPLDLIKEKHAGQTRPGGEPQLLHALRVGTLAAQFTADRDRETRLTVVSAALCHDILEDTDVSDEELAQWTSPAVAQIVRAVSHEEEEEPDEVYLARVAAEGPLAVLVKRCDRLDNLKALRQMPADFRSLKLLEVWAALPLWEAIDPEGYPAIEALCADVAAETIAELRATPDP